MRSRNIHCQGITTAHSGSSLRSCSLLCCNRLHAVFGSEGGPPSGGKVRVTGDGWMTCLASLLWIRRGGVKNPLGTRQAGPFLNPTHPRDQIPFCVVLYCHRPATIQQPPLSVGCWVSWPTFLPPTKGGGVQPSS